MKISLGARLSSAKDFVRRGAAFADVGTDHGYLPIALLQEGAISSAVLTDIAEAPLASARENVAEAGLSDRVSFRLCDGAESLAGDGITDLAVCGMGGEMIAGIVERASFLRDPKIRLILQPMSRPAALRRYLAEAGFAVLDERYTVDAGKAYVCLAACYDGEKRELSGAEAEFGTLLLKSEFSEAEARFFRTRVRALLRAEQGKDRGEIDAGYERAVLCEVREKLPEALTSKLFDK